VSIPTRKRRAIANVALVVAVGLVASSCGGGGSEATLPAERRGPATVYVALGGDDNGGGRRPLGSSWPHDFFRTAFPRSAVFFNLSSPRAGAATVLATAVGEAVRLHPDVVTITVMDDAEHGTAAASVEHDLVAAIDRLRGTHTRVLVGTVPDALAPANVVQPIDQAVEAAAQATGATVVDLGSAPGVRDEGSRTAIARAFAATLRKRAAGTRGTPASP
jgi:hypothetical protein